jgi:hypothetical protein
MNVTTHVSLFSRKRDSDRTAVSVLKIQRFKIIGYNDRRHVKSRIIQIVLKFIESRLKQMSVYKSIN